MVGIICSKKCSLQFSLILKGLRLNNRRQCNSVCSLQFSLILKGLRLTVGGAFLTSNKSAVFPDTEGIETSGNLTHSLRLTVCSFP